LPTIFGLIFGKLLLVASYFVAMLLHEISHYLVARKLKYKCAEMQISAFGAVLYGDFSQAVGKDLALIAMAGPLANVVVCASCASVWWFFPEIYGWTLDFCEANLAMALTNLLPAYPLDGGRIVIGVLGKRFSYEKCLKSVKNATAIIASALFALFLIGLAVGTNLFSVAVFAVFLASGMLVGDVQRSYVKISYAEMARTKAERGVEKKTLVFTQNATVAQVAKKMTGNFLYEIEVWNGDRLFASINFFEIEEILTYSPSNQTLGECVKNRRLSSKR